MEKKELEKELRRLKREVQRIYKNTTQAYRQKAAMSKLLNYKFNKISYLENELYNLK